MNTSFGSIQYAQSNLSANYNGMTAAVRNRGTHGLSTQIAYTLGKSLDQASSAGGGLNVVDPLNLRAEYGPADFDVRNRLSISLLYELPGAKLSNRFERAALGGWEIGDITILQAGTPFSVFCSRQFQFGTLADGKSPDYTRNVGCDYNADGFNYDRPNAPTSGNTLRGVSRKQYRAGLFGCDSAVALCGNIFSAPTIGREGNLGRNTYRNPGFAESDLSLLKNTRFKALGREDLNFQFRAEAQNIFNRTNLTGVTGDLNSGQFGQATSSYAPRQFQFGARLLF